MMELFERKTVDFEHSDDRGKLTQLVHEGYSQINVLETKKGVMRSLHYHKISKEVFFVVSGSVEVTLRYEEVKKVVTFKKNDFFEIKPYVVHGFFFPEDCILVALYDKSVEQEDGSIDIYRE